MKKLLIILILITIGCNKEDEDSGCTCTGKYTMNNGQSYFYANNVDCNTGYREGSPIQSNALYLGCDN